MFETAYTFGLLIVAQQALSFRRTYSETDFTIVAQQALSFRRTYSETDFTIVAQQALGERIVKQTLR